MNNNRSYANIDPTPDVPRGVVNWPRQRAFLEAWAAHNSIFSDDRGYLSGAISEALQYLDMFAKDNQDFQLANATLQAELTKYKGKSNQ